MANPQIPRELVLSQRKFVNLPLRLNLSTLLCLRVLPGDK